MQPGRTDLCTRHGSYSPLSTRLFILCFYLDVSYDINYFYNFSLRQLLRRLEALWLVLVTFVWFSPRPQARSLDKRTADFCSSIHMLEYVLLAKCIDMVWKTDQFIPQKIKFQLRIRSLLQLYALS